jgi:FixJ family two-component response regulator
MPEMNGRRLAEALLSMRPDTKVIYMSGHTEDSMVRHGVLAARVDYLQKPFTAAVLATKVRDVLDRSEGLDLDPESGG